MPGQVIEKTLADGLIVRVTPLSFDPTPVDSGEGYYARFTVEIIDGEKVYSGERGVVFIAGQDVAPVWQRLRELIQARVAEIRANKAAVTAAAIDTRLQQVMDALAV